MEWEKRNASKEDRKKREKYFFKNIQIDESNDWKKIDYVNDKDCMKDWLERKKNKRWE